MVVHRLKVAQVCNRYFPTIGGVQTHVKEISERLAKKGYNFQILTTDSTGKLSIEEKIGDVKVRRFKSFAPMNSFYFSCKMKQFLKQNSDQYDIVHAHNFQALPILYAAQTKATNKLVITPHYHGHGHTFVSNLFYRPYRSIAKKIFEKSDMVICVSKSEKALITDHFNIEEEKITIIPNGLNPEEFKQLKKQNKQNQTILYVGRLEKYKGINYLLMALEKLDENIFLEIVGKGPMKKELIKLTKKLKISSRVIFHQELSRRDLLQSYSNADLFVLLSRYESYGIAVMEALASKTPCLVAKTSSLKDWIDNKNCFGINYPIDVKELANRIETTIGKKVTEIKFTTWDDVALKIEEVYKKVCVA